MIQLSIIVPIYNKADYLDNCLESVLNQSFTTFELILINDGSTDASGEICDYYEKKDARVKVIHQSNGGVSKARNAGLAVASGTYIGFVDSDDVLEMDMYETLISNAQTYNAEVSICGVRRITPGKVQHLGGQTGIKIYQKDEAVSALLNGELLLSTYEKIFKASTVKNIMYEPPLFEDTFYNFEALKNAERIVYDPAIKYNYILRGNSHSMASFNAKYMNTTVLSKKMLDITCQELPSLTDQAKVFDFNTNLMVLNIILMESKTKHYSQYCSIANNLKAYASYYLTAKGIKAKRRYGYLLFRVSPTLYQWVLKLYGYATQSDHLKRKAAAT
ncbi:glycosyltransferase [Spirosoma pollinicola]|uniref:Glycosyltransferase 2-like domain-containing protein n=1 Tax=Spirosoma pollinicola TaxID=2057025 RepID=A0A2K8ZAI2_9BACT|nr:glycosyltransferase [Spirosoma pollinicola]AUD06888.1 hypothetical protein CWM47_36625 [Spirosoma pollinicola]